MFCCSTGDSVAGVRLGLRSLASVLCPSQGDRSSAVKLMFLPTVALSLFFSSFPRSCDFFYPVFVCFVFLLLFKLASGIRVLSFRFWCFFPVFWGETYIFLLLPNEILHFLVLPNAIVLFFNLTINVFLSKPDSVRWRN